MCILRHIFKCVLFTFGMDETNWQDESEQEPNMSRVQRLEIRTFKIKVQAAAREFDSALTEVIKEEISSAQHNVNCWQNSKKLNKIWSYVNDGIIAINLGFLIASTYASQVTMRESLDSTQNIWFASATLLPAICRFYCEISDRYLIPAAMNAAKKNLDELTQIYSKHIANSA